MTENKKELDSRLLAAIELMEISFANSRAYSQEQRKLIEDPEYREKKYREMEEAQRAWRRKASHLPDDNTLYY